MVKFLNLSIVQLILNLYEFVMFKKIVILIFLVMPLTQCSSLSELNERAKGDGVPYIPGI